MTFVLPPPPSATTPEAFNSPQWQAWIRQLSHITSNVSVGLTMPTSTFSVTGSPVNTNGTFGVTFNTQSPNLTLMSPISGTGVPTWRSITRTDLPADIASSNVLLWMSF